MDVHDFRSDDVGKAIPYGVYDLAANEGCVSVGGDHETPILAVRSLALSATPRRARYSLPPTPRRARPTGSWRCPTGKKISTKKSRELKVEREESNRGQRNYVIKSRMERR